jgi:hypothetical protein
MDVHNQSVTELADRGLKIREKRLHLQSIWTILVLSNYLFKTNI